MCDTTILVWGRMNPPTKGHELLVSHARELGEQLSGEVKIFLSHTHDKKTNPLKYDDKIAAAQLAFGDVVMSSPCKTIMQVLKSIGAKNLVMVCGSDRLEEFNALLNKYNNIEYNFDSIEVVSGGERDPDGDELSAMSASALRQKVLKHDYQGFKSGLPTGLYYEAQHLYQLILEALDE